MLVWIENSMLDKQLGLAMLVRSEKPTALFEAGCYSLKGGGGPGSL